MRPEGGNSGGESKEIPRIVTFTQKRGGADGKL